MKSHDMLITEKSKMLIMTILDTLINPTTMKNVTIVIDDKHEYLSSTKTHRRKRKSGGSFDQVSPVKQRIIGQSHGSPITTDQGYNFNILLEKYHFQYFQK